MSQAELKLQSLYPNLSRAERKLADYILSDRERVPLQSVREIAAAGRASVATVSRLVRKLGYRSLKDFKVELARVPPSTITYFYQQIRDQDSEEEVLDKVFAGNIKSLEDTLRILDRRRLREAAQRICRSRRLIFLGIGSSGFLARDAAMRFSFLGFAAQAFSDPNEIYFHASGAGREDTVIGISHSGRTRVTVEGLRLARGNRAATIGISNYLQSPLHGQSRYFFCTSFPESQVKVTALSSRIAQMCLLDALYLLCARCRKNLRHLERMNSRLEDLLRFPEGIARFPEGIARFPEGAARLPSGAARTPQS